jgi:Type II secretion system (T2SS), protein E, N-terminal domain
MPRLGDILLRTRQLTESQLQTAVTEQRRWGGLLGEILLRMDYISEPMLVDALTRQMGIAVAEPGLLRSPEASALRRMPLEVAKKLRAIPLQIREKGKLMSVAMCEPQNLLLLDELRKTTGCRVAPSLIGPLTFIKLLNEHYGAEDVQEEPVEGSFKMVDAQGRTVVKAGVIPQPPPSSPSLDRPAVPFRSEPPSARSASAVTETLTQLESSQRQEVAALRAMVELLIERGVFTREEYLARVRK